MCDFHSVIVDGAGRIYHQPSNSHSGIAAHYNLNNAGMDSAFWECEWDGLGEQPVHLCQQRGKTGEPTAVAVSAVDKHYAKLAAIMNGSSELHWSAVAPFNTDEYSDVPARIDWAAKEIQRRAEREAQQAKAKAERENAEQLGASIFASVGAAIEGLSDEGMILAIRAFINELSVSMEDVANEEIEAGKEGMIDEDSAYDYVLGDGDYVHSDEMDDWARNNDYYDQDALDSAIDEAKAEWIKEVVAAVENVG